MNDATGKESGLTKVLAGVEGRKNKKYYEIRLESIGGLGANLCGTMLGELGVKYLDCNSSNFSSYGSEKNGTPVKGYVRYCRKEQEIRVHSPVTEPDLLVVFHQALLRDSSVLAGCGDKTVIVVALEQGQRELKVPLPGICFGVEATRIAMETNSRMNTVLFGSALRLMGLPDVKAGEQICRDLLGEKYPENLSGNLEGLRKGYEEVRRLDLPARCIQKEVPPSRQSAHLPGGINCDIGSTVVADLSPSRQGYFPIFLKERCINCGLCFSTCPDMVFQFEWGEYKGREMMVNSGLDYYHCKGCMRCVDICPVNALVAGVEAEHEEKHHFSPNRELLLQPAYYEEAGADGYITSESFLTEKRMGGGEV